jgi:ribonuclease BN (tRNA processing enzyme)
MTARDRGTAKVTVLGSGDAFGSDGRLQSSYLVEGPDATFLMDCGPAILPALKRNGIDSGRIDFVLISHLHGDHFGGLAFLFLEYMYENIRSRPLMVAGPPGLEARVRKVFAGLFQEAAESELPFPLEFRELSPGQVDAIGSVEVSVFRVPHQTTCISLGVKVTMNGCTILYSGDSAWSEDFVSQSQGTDLFICECVFLHTRVPFHMNYQELVEHVPRLGCKRLVLSHLGSELLAARASVKHECVDDGTVIVV